MTDRVVPPTKPEPQCEIDEQLWSKSLKAVPKILDQLETFGSRDAAKTILQLGLYNFAMQDRNAEAVAPPVSPACQHCNYKFPPDNNGHCMACGEVFALNEAPPVSTAPPIESTGTDTPNDLAAHIVDDMFDPASPEAGIALAAMFRTSIEKFSAAPLRPSAPGETLTAEQFYDSQTEFDFTLEAQFGHVTIMKFADAVSAHNVAASREALETENDRLSKQWAETALELQTWKQLAERAKTSREALIREIAQEIEREVPDTEQFVTKLLTKYGVKEK